MIKPGQSFNDMKKEDATQGSFEPATTLQSLGISQNTAQQAKTGELGPQPSDSSTDAVTSLRDKLKMIQTDLLNAAKTKPPISDVPVLALSEKEAEKVANGSKEAQGGVEKSESCQKCGDMHKTEECKMGKSLRDMKKSDAMEGKMGLHVLKFPSGKHGFVGTVPKDLAITHADGKPLSDLEFDTHKKSSNPAMSKRSNGYKEPTFDTREQAVAHAEKMGHKVEAEPAKADIAKTEVLKADINPGKSFEQMKKAAGYAKPSVASMRNDMAASQGVAPGANGKVPSVKQDHVTGVKSAVEPGHPNPLATRPMAPPQATEAVKPSAAPTAPKREFVQGKRMRKSDVPLKGMSMKQLFKAQADYTESLIKALPETVSAAKAALSKIKGK
jgi:hypothetical protein